MSDILSVRHFQVMSAIEGTLAIPKEPLTHVNRTRKAGRLTRSLLLVLLILLELQALHPFHHN